MEWTFTNIFKKALKTPPSFNTMFNMYMGLDSFKKGLKGNLSSLTKSAAPANNQQIVRELEAAHRYFNRATVPNVLLNLPRITTGLAGIATLGILGKHIADSYRAHTLSQDLEGLYKQLVEIEPDIKNYSKDRALRYLATLLEHSKELATKPRILASVLDRILPYPTFPFEQLTQLEKVSPYGKSIKTIADTMKGMSYASKLF